MSDETFEKSQPNIARLKLEAVFHPKFENESPDAEIRRKMLAKVSSGEGYLEASLKHSGSLLLWSGRQRFYSKNSTNNIFTHVGEIMLMQHFLRCFGAIWREEYERCSEFVHQNRLTCSFEVVTSILGHHGDLPKRDYLILISVADRGRARGIFYSTNELIRFAQKFRLPHNDAWVLPSRAACESLFHSYDEMRETGTATIVIEQLDQIVLCNEGGQCAKVASLHPHDIFQGDILEGIVIRFVPYTTPNDVAMDGCDARHNDLEEMKALSTSSYKLLSLVLPSKTLDTQSTTATENLNIDPIQLVKLRSLAAMDDFEQQVENVLRSFHGPNFRRIQLCTDFSGGGSETTTETNCINIVDIAGEILSSSSTNTSLYDQETFNIARLIQTLDQIKIKVSYKVLTEKTLVGSEARFLCILHIPQDSSFSKYNSRLRQGESGGMMLFRGFSFELVPTDDCNFNVIKHDHKGLGKKKTTTEKKNISLGTAKLNHANDEKLMLKMKFLPYMVRTFICRNGLSILQSSGAAAFEKYAISQLTRWRVSDESVRKWMPFFNGWARYCSSPMSRSFPPLSEKTYLHHYSEYDELFANGNFQSINADESSFRGLIVIVGPTKSNLEALSLGVSKELQCSKIVRNMNEVTNADVLLSMQRSGGGLVCIAEIEDGCEHLRKLAKKNHKALYIIMVEGDLEETPGADIDCLQKIKSTEQGWRQVKRNMLLDLPKDAANQADAETTLEHLRTNDSAKRVMTKLKASFKNNQPGDERPGLIVYFPSIPGLGKSSLCQNTTVNTLGMGENRKLVLIEGDRVRKIYKSAKRIILTKPASVVILDKNVPPASFSSVHNMCIETKSIALHVLPDGMRDTLVGNGASLYVYPFSLQYLAACMSRVLRREPNTHKGKLDAATKNACMVVVRFYCFYRSMSASALKETLLNIGCQGEEIVIPFFRDKMLPDDLPTDLRLALENAIILQTNEDMNGCKAGKGAVDMEESLRSSIRGNESYIDNLTVSLERSKQVFVSELSRVIASLPNKLDPRTLALDPKAGTIKIVSLDLKYEVVHSEIEKLRKSFPEVEQYFAEREEHKNNDENDSGQNRFITSLHYTFAHASQLTQATMISTFQPLLGTSVEINAISILFNDKIAAFELEMPNLPSVPRPQNTFPHVTIWCAEDTKAFESNQLPEKVKCNVAKRIGFKCHVVMHGNFSFWYY